MRVILNRWWLFATVVLFFAIYALLPTANSTADAWAYATDVKYGQNLFRPHHLLYNSLGLLITRIIHWFSPGVDVLLVLKFQNALFTSLSLLMLYLILIKLKTDKFKTLSLLIFAGSSFATMRFATDNETYAVPIFFSMVSSYFYLIYHQNQKKYYLWLIGLSAAISCLFHQIHIFWGLALGISILITFKWKAFIHFFAPTLTVLLAYIAVVFYQNQTIPTIQEVTNYVLTDYISGQADTQMGMANFFMTPISLFRTFYQVHGSILFLFNTQKLLYLVALITLLLLASAIKLIVCNRLNIFKNIELSPFGKLHLYILAMQLLFAFFSHGNAEFMVMTPILLAIVLAMGFSRINAKPILYIGLSMMAWNIGVSIYPSHQYNFYGYNQLLEIIHKQPNDGFILWDKNSVANQYEYYYGEDINHRLFSGNFNERQPELCNILQKGYHLYSNLNTQPKFLNRQKLLTQSHSEMRTTGTSPIIINSYFGSYALQQVSITCPHANSIKKMH